MAAAPLWTPRLWLTPLEPLHLGAWQALLRDEAVRRHLRDGAPDQRAWLEGELRASDARFAAGDVGIFLAWLRAGGELCGFGGLRPAGDPPRLELLFGLDPRCYGQGLAGEACRALVEHAFVGGRDDLACSVDETNSAARRLCERLGFVPDAASDGRLRFVLMR